jgi:putative ABC transport system permease protein
VLTLRLAFRSLANRRLATVLTVVSIALSVALLVGVENVRRGIRESFAGTIRGTDLIVGARGGGQQLLLSSIFGLGAPAGTVSWTTYQRWAGHPAVAWTIPISLGDSYHGYRVVGTTAAFFTHYRFRGDGQPTLAAGASMSGDRDVVLGHEVARVRGLGLGDEIALTHGLRGTGIMDHEEHPFRVSGILAPTYTPIDRSLYVSLDGIDAMHAGFIGMAPPTATAVDDGPAISAFLLGTRNRIESLKLQREISTDASEPLTAILPAVALTELWHTIGYAEDGARVITTAVVIVGLMGMLVSLYSTLEERRREMAILRSLGAGPRRIAALLVFESGVLSVLGAAVGVGLSYLTLTLGAGIAERHFGIAIPVTAPQRLEWLYLAGVVVAGVLVGLLPAWRAYRHALQDGLAIRL